ncbi:GNAT family N-acetyltransferase [Roseibium algae]|uniref:GNAT family N-acetyltransferase n=1 Tax=Roseibium algae TaxID=3123038 RepID=A0ABU8TQC9_9HYPH
MNSELIELRPAEGRDCKALASIHSAAWLGAYRGLLNGIELDRMIARRSPAWWQGALSKGVQIKVLDVAGEPAGYATFGSSRIPLMAGAGEIYELYLKPEYQGLGFGRKLFETVRKDLAVRHPKGLAIQVLSENGPARAFYQALGGQLIPTTTQVSPMSRLELSVYFWSGVYRQPSRK